MLMGYILTGGEREKRVLKRIEVGDGFVLLFDEGEIANI